MSISMSSGLRTVGERVVILCSQSCLLAGICMKKKKAQWWISSLLRSNLGLFNLSRENFFCPFSLSEESTVIDLFQP